jgi:type IV pilus assembly protein PilC
MARISIGQTSKMCHRIGSSLEAGVDVVQVLQREARSGTPAFQRNMARVEIGVGKGQTIAEAMKDCGGYFPPLVCELIDVGEETGRLESVLLRLAEHYQHLIKLRRVFLLGILWPGLNLTMAVLAIGGLILLPPLLFGVSVPVFGLSGPTGALIFFGLVAVVGVTLFGVSVGLLRGWFGPLPSRLLLYLPGVGKAIRTMALARLSWTLSIALESGVDAGRSMRLALQSTRLHYFARHVDEVDATIERGGQFHEALARTGVFPRDFLTALENAELSGTESESLARMSADYQSQAESASTALAVIASMAIWVLVGVLMVAMIVYLFMTLYMRPIQDALDMTV